MPWRKAPRVRRKWREELGNLSAPASKRMHKPLLRVRATKLRAWAFLVLLRKSEILQETKTEATPPMPMAALDRVRDGTVGGETLGEIEGNLDDCINGGLPLQVLMEGRVVADFCVNLTKGNIFKRSVRFTPMVCACKFWKSSRENLLTVDHYEVEFVQRGREIVRREGGRRPHRCAVWGWAAWSFLGCGEPVEPRSKTEQQPLGWHYRHHLEEVCCSQRPSGDTVEKAIPRTVVGYILDVHRAFGRQLVRERVVIMTKGHGLSRGVL